MFIISPKPLFLKTVENNFQYIDAILPLAVQQTFTYHLPDEYIGKVEAGCRVIVQFGNRKLYTALVKRVHSEKPEHETKPIELLLDEKPVISERMIVFWEWIASYYLCSNESCPAVGA